MKKYIPFILLIIPVLYLLTLAQEPVFGDPAEYTVVANTLSIAHPPGYAFFTLVGKVFQTIVPIGSIAWRMHALSALAGTLGGVLVYLIIRALDTSDYAWVAGLFGGLVVATAVDHWQHSIHANPHIVTAVFLALNLFLLTSWGRTGQDRWLYLFCLSAGVGLTHHPLTVFGFLAYTIFIIWIRPRILRSPKTLLTMLACALLGLIVWLYFPIRSPMQPPLGPITMNTLDGFLDHVLARGLSESLPTYGWRDQWNRTIVFWSLLRLQYSLPTLFLAMMGLGWLLRPQGRFTTEGESRRLPYGVLYLVAFVSIYAFVITLRVQDIMAYLLGPFLLIGLLAGIGLLALLHLFGGRVGHNGRLLALLAIPIFLLGPVLQVARNLPRISLANYTEAGDYAKEIFTHFAGSQDGAILLNNWEHMTPYWYETLVQGHTLAPEDVEVTWVSTGGANPWLEATLANVPRGTVYLSDYRPEVVQFGFRLRPEGSFYRVVDQADRLTIPETLTLLAVDDSRSEVELVGYELPQTEAVAGDVVTINLAFRAPTGTDDYYVPVVRVGEITYEFTTDSHLITPLWEPNEVIVEPFVLALPHELANGRYPITLDLKNLSQDEMIPLGADLGELVVTEQAFPPRTDDLLANYRQRVGLVSARVDGVPAGWQDPLVVARGDGLPIRLRWRGLAPIDESMTIFVHLIDADNRPIVDDLDYTPLGGAFPTQLWFPKWLAGQEVTDPYTLTIPPDLPDGLYYIEVGMYEMISKRRLHLHNEQGDIVGDRFILGALQVGE